MSRNDRRRGALGRLYHGETNIDFLGRAKLCFAVSGLVIAAGLVTLLTRGLNLGIEFAGGTSFVVPAEVEVADARDTVESLGAADANIQTLGDDEGQRLRVQTEPGAADTNDVRQALADQER